MKLMFITTRNSYTKVSASRSNGLPTEAGLLLSFGWRRLAERQGFEPWVEKNPTTVFETVLFNHSSISPLVYSFLINFVNTYSSQEQFCPLELLKSDAKNIYHNKLWLFLEQK
jgi:hypothetical protein